MAAGHPLPLAGRTLAVKDNIDVAGVATTAGCPSYAYLPPASAPSVQALVDAGAVVVGKTNLDQFATGLVGTRSPHGACPNAHWDGLVSGGSSSGSAVAVAAGLVDLALGTDTAGSGRVPAAANGIVGVKPTKGRLSTAGVVPACRSLDCVSVFARTVAEAAAVAELAAAAPVRADDPWRRSAPPGTTASAAAAPSAPLRIGVPSDAALTFDGEEAGPARFAGAVAALVAAQPAGAQFVEVDLAPFSAAAALLYGGSFVAERYDAVGAFVASAPPDLDPVVASIVLAAAEHPAWSVFRDQTELRRLAMAAAPTWDAVDLLVLPTVPRVPTIAEVAADPIGVNSMLGTYTNFVNLLDLAAVTVPVAPSGSSAVPAAGPPPSLTLVGPAWSDGLLADVGGRIA
ncbi:allophanate hydrolase [Aquihabitans sp. G128]|uniref:allophanate hydrolase n=1 Tax=Aquihabitans sp. G128 TaxID=2849779 RepID=UPI001C245060|nr:allophanate hydrolase [Aquihabitans sp. G128]